MTAATPHPGPHPGWPHPAESRGIAHDPTLDGLRGVAILCAALAACLVSPGQSRLSGVLAQAIAQLGFALFLALSGYLLTCRLWAALRSRTPSVQPHWLARFYLGRALRILPLYYALLLLAAAVAIVRGTRLADLAPLRLYAGFVANLPFLTENASQQPSLLSLDHLWPVIVIFQLACAWPLLLWVAARRESALALALGLAATSLAFCIAVWALPISPGLVHHHLFDQFPLTYAHTFALGAALALARGSTACDRIELWLRVALLLGLAGWLLSAALQLTVLPGPRVSFVLGFPCAGIAATSLLALALVPGGLRQQLRRTPLRWLGWLSYGLFLLLPLLLPFAGRIALSVAQSVAQRLAQPGAPSGVQSVGIASIPLLLALRALLAGTLAIVAAFLSSELLDAPLQHLRHRLRT